MAGRFVDDSGQRMKKQSSRKTDKFHLWVVSERGISRWIGEIAFRWLISRVDLKANKQANWKP